MMYDILFRKNQAQESRLHLKTKDTSQYSRNKFTDTNLYFVYFGVNEVTGLNA